MSETPEEKPHLSHTQLSMLEKCGQMYFFRYVEGIKSPQSVPLVVGKATHKSIEGNLATFMRTQHYLSMEEIRSITRDAVTAAWHTGVQLNDDEAKLGIKAVKDRAIDQSLALAELHATRIAPNLRPTHIERKFLIELSGYPYDLLGYIDVQEGNETVRDTKTTKRAPVGDAAANSMQLTLYGLAIKVMDGEYPQKFVLDHLVKTKDPKVVVQEADRRLEDYEMLLRRIHRAIEVIDKGAFTPTNPDNWWCSKSYCSYWNDCQFARRPVSVAV